MTEAGRHSLIRRLTFGCFLVLIFSLGLMKPGVDLWPVALTPTDIVFPVLLVLWVIALATRVESFKWRPEYFALAFYFLTLAVSAVFSDSPRMSIIKLAGVAYLILLAVITSNIASSNERLRPIAIAWLAGSVIPIAVAAAAIVAFYSGVHADWMNEVISHYGAVPVGNFPRVNSTFVSPSMFCNYLTVTLVMTLIAWKQGWIGRNVCAAIAIILSIVALFTVSINLGGIALAFGLWIATTEQSRPVRATALLLGFAVAILFLAISPFALSYQASAPYLIDLPLIDAVSPSSRLLVWNESLTTFLADPLTGKGVGTAVASVAYQNFDGSWSLLTDAHNTFLSIAAQAGLLGLLGLCMVIAAVVRSRANSPVRTGLLIAFVAAFFYDGLTGSFEDARHLWVLIGLILARTNQE